MAEWTAQFDGSDGKVRVRETANLPQLGGSRGSERVPLTGLTATAWNGLPVCTLSYTAASPLPATAERKSEKIPWTQLIILYAPHPQSEGGRPAPRAEPSSPAFGGGRPEQSEMVTCGGKGQAPVLPDVSGLLGKRGSDTMPGHNPEAGHVHLLLSGRSWGPLSS